MRATECPNCYTTVIFKDDGLCPACHLAPDAPTADRTKTKVTIWEGQDLPDVCFCCGNQTTSMMVIRRSSSSPRLRVLKIFLNVILFPLKLLMFGLRRMLADDTGSRCYQSLKVKVPVCLKCRNGNSPHIVGTHFEEGTISFIVPRSVKDEILNSKKSSSSSHRSEC